MEDLLGYTSENLTKELTDNNAVYEVSKNSQPGTIDAFEYPESRYEMIYKYDYYIYWKVGYANKTPHPAHCIGYAFIQNNKVSYILVYPKTPQDALNLFSYITSLNYTQKDSQHPDLPENCYFDSRDYSVETRFVSLKSKPRVSLFICNTNSMYAYKGVTN